ncbi:hypothetical protein DIPPA_24497 [Diplonema papillatum]|nr:hypothetical protein DIPPA_24497 [Diplonema papillatum]
MGLLLEGKDVKWLEEELEKEASRPRNKKQLEELWKRWIDLWGHDVAEDISFRLVFLNSNALRNVLKAAFTTKDVSRSRRSS